jgi:hypothetical protein
MDRLPYSDNPTLFGSDPKEGIVAVEIQGDDLARIYVRTPKGIAEEEDRF